MTEHPHGRLGTSEDRGTIIAAVGDLHAYVAGSGRIAVYWFAEPLPPDVNPFLGGRPANRTAAATDAGKGGLWYWLRPGEQRIDFEGPDLIDVVKASASVTRP